MCENPEVLDTTSSVSRQHYVDTGHYLTTDEVRELAWQSEGAGNDS